MYCKNCGAKLVDGTSFCPYCGQELNKKVDSKKNEDETLDLTEEELENIPYSMHQEMKKDNIEEEQVIDINTLNSEEEKITKENAPYLVEQRNLDRKARCAFIFSLFGSLFSWTSFLSPTIFVVLSILSIILGATSLKSRKYHKLAKAAFIIGIISTSIFIVGCMFSVFFDVLNGNQDPNTNSNLDELIKVLLIRR